MASPTVFYGKLFAVVKSRLIDLETQKWATRGKRKGSLRD